VLIGGGLAAAALLWCGVLLVALPRGLGDLVLHDRLWHLTYPLVFPMTIAVMGACFSSGATAGLRALGVATRSLRAGLFGSVTYIAGCLIGAFLGGAVGAVYGSAVGTTVGALVWWRQLQVALHEAEVPSVRILPGTTGRHRIDPASRAGMRKPAGETRNAGDRTGSRFNLDENSA
jgi:hypothetical protein